MDTQRLEDFLLDDGLPVPLNHLKERLEISEDYALGARKCASFFRSMEEHFKVDELWGKFFEPQVPEKWLEYVLFCIFDIGYPHLQIAEQVLRLKCLRRALMRKGAGCRLDAQEMEFLDGLREVTGISEVTQLLSWAYSARQFVVNVVSGKPCREQQRSAIVYLIRCEVAALKNRITRISDSIDVYNMRAMARVLPSIRTFDENARDADRLATAIENNEGLEKRSLTIVEALNCESFDQWIKPIRKNPEFALLFQTFEAQLEKLVPTRSLIALSSLFRWIDESRHRKSGPLDWINSALAAYTRNRFSVDAGPAIGSIGDMVTNGGAWVDGSVVSGNFSDRLYSQWIGPDMLTRPFQRAEQEKPEEKHVTYRQLISAHIHNDALIDKLLDVSTVYQTSGLVEYITTRSRSPRILTKIATRNNLHSGSGNGGVPRALLKNPAPLPIDLLRQFIKRSYFNMVELRTLLNDGTIRPEVIKEIRGYLLSH